MTLRPVPAHWFELVTVHKELARVMECLSRTGAVELEARSRASDRLLFPGLDDELKAHQELARRYHQYWPQPAAGESRRSEPLGETLRSARARLAAWVKHADPIIAKLERLSQETVDLRQLLDALQWAGAEFPDLKLLCGAGPKLGAQLIMLPAGVLLREVPALTLFKFWPREGESYALVVGRPADVGEIEAQLPALKGHVVPLPPWLPASPQEAAAAIAQRLERCAREQAEAQAQLASLSQREHLAQALGDIALIEWLNAHGSELRGSERLAWVTGWTSDVGGEALRRALDASGVRYILRLSEAPEGASAPLVLHNPGWARSFEVFPQMLGTPGPNESDPSQILAVVASAIFGFMFGDIGQGAVVLVAGLVLGRRYPLTRLMVPGGAMAILFGFLFGSVFGREDIIPALWLHPLQHPIEVLIAAVVAGMVIISVGLLLDAIQMHWRGAGLQWWMHRAGLTVAYAGLMIAPLRQEGLVVAAAGAIWFVIGSAVVARAGLLGAIAGAAAEFVEQTLRLLVNTVSFARIGAFALAHSGLSVAVIEMAEASGSIGYWIVFALGNILVIALEGLVVSIQTTRLLLFEFFIRFLTGAGRAFKPLPPPAIVRDMSKPA